MDVSFTNSRASIASARHADTDWASLSVEQRIRSIELDGYVVIPDLFPAGQLDAIRGELSRLPTTSVDYSEYQRGCPNVQWSDSPTAIRVIALPAMIINQKVFHANYPNYSDRDRRMLAIVYRPAWAGPIGDVPGHDPERVESLPPEVRPFFRSRNTRQIEYDLPNRPDNMARSAPGISPQRGGLVSIGSQEGMP